MPFVWSIIFSTLSLRAYICSCSWDVSPGDSPWVGFSFWCNLLPCTLLLVSSVHLHLGWLVIYEDFLPIYLWFSSRTISLLFLCLFVAVYISMVVFYDVSFLCYTFPGECFFFSCLPLTLCQTSFILRILHVLQHSSLLYSRVLVQTFSLSLFMLLMSQIIPIYTASSFLSLQ